MGSRSSRWLILLLAAATVWGFLDVRRRGYPYPECPEEHRTDLTVYTEAGAAFFDGRNPYEVTNPRGWTYLYPPLFALLLAPLHPLPMQDQVTVWFFVNLLICWGCYRECRRIVTIVSDEDPRVRAAWTRWLPWLGVAAVAAAALPTLNCLQRGQVGIVKMYLLLLGLRVILNGRSVRSWLTGGVVLALPVVLKIVPALPVGFLLFLQLAEWGWSYLKRRAPGGADIRAPGGADIPVCHMTAGESGRQECLPHRVRCGVRFTSSTLGFSLGLVLFFLIVPAMLVGWSANLHHLDTWGRFMLTKADNGGMDPRSGNSHSARNQSLQNAAYRLGNFGSHVFADGPDDRLVENFDAPKMAMDSPASDCFLFLSRAMLGLALLALGVRLARQPGNKLNMATGFALACVTMLAVSPVARAHYFLLLAPAILLVPLWLDRHGRPQAGVVMAAIPPVLSVLHYVLLPYGGRVGLLGFGTTAWLMAAMVLIARTDWALSRTAEGKPAPADTIGMALNHAA
ncbi:MAG: glycosyltransferase 87 family protein [Thermoguttaceae bacterium]